MCNFNHCRNGDKANVLLLLILSLVTQKILQCTIDITTEQSFRYMELAHAKPEFSKMHYVRVFVNQVTTIKAVELV